MKRCSAVCLILLPALCCFAQSPDPKNTESLPKLAPLDVTQVDRSANPCENFYQYACSKVDAASPIPPDESWWGSFGKLEEWNREVLRQILETNQAPKPNRTPNEQKIGDLYAACMSQASSKGNDLPAVQPLLAQIDGMHAKSDIPIVLAAIHKSFGTAWTSGDNQAAAPLFGFGPTPDANDVSRVVAGVDQGGLGMPNRDFYLGDNAALKGPRERYEQLLSILLQAAGASPETAAQNVSTIMRVETAIAQAQMDNITRRDPNKTNNRYTLAQLKTLTPDFDWDSYMKAIAAPAVPLYEVSAPDFFRGLNKLLVDNDLATWKLYLRSQLLFRAASALGQPWRDDLFTYTSAITGESQQPPNWRRCATTVDHYLGEALGQVYVSQVFPAESKERVEKMVKAIEAAMGRDIDAATWMQPATKREAHLKLAAVIDKIGYPDKWIDYTSLEITRESFPQDVERGTAFEFKRQLAFMGKPLDRTQWGMTPPTVDAYEDPQTNTINFPAGILQPVFFNPAADDVVNYGAVGAVIGHELTHDFDDQGRKFDVKGDLRDWWTPEDAKQYESRSSCIAHEYSGPLPGFPGLETKGELTLGEDTADNGGIHLALSALTLDLQAQGKTLQDKDSSGFTNLQRFFIAYGNVWCTQMRPEMVRTLVLTNPHSVPQLRVNNVISNMPEFSHAFSCKAGQPMSHETQCRVW
jgi:putative endopeptidase